MFYKDWLALLFLCPMSNCSLSLSNCSFYVHQFFFVFNYEPTQSEHLFLIRISTVMFRTPADIQFWGYDWASVLTGVKMWLKWVSDTICVFMCVLSLDDEVYLHWLLYWIFLHCEIQRRWVTHSDTSGFSCVSLDVYKMMKRNFTGCTLVWLLSSVRSGDCVNWGIREMTHRWLSQWSVE